jgi:hypothetical protein
MLYFMYSKEKTVARSGNEILRWLLTQLGQSRLVLGGTTRAFSYKITRKASSASNISHSHLPSSPKSLTFPWL